VNRGRFIVFEGLDGSGKSTQVERLASALRAAGHDVLATAEPTRGEWGRRIRAAASGGEPVTAEQELEWFFADRREHVRDTVEPALAAGRTVVCDRYYLSTVAYQGAAGLDWRIILADSEAEFPAPDVVLLLEIDPAAGLARVRGRGDAVETLFEDEARLARVAAIFAALDLPTLERIDAARDPDEVARDVRSRLAGCF